MVLICINYQYLNLARLFALCKPRRAWFRVDAYADGPIQPGARLTQVRSLLGQKIEATAEVTAIDPPNSLSFTSIGGGMINLLGTYLFDAMGGGTYSR